METNVKSKSFRFVLLNLSITKIFVFIVYMFFPRGDTMIGIGLLVILSVVKCAYASVVPGLSLLSCEYYSAETILRLIPDCCYDAEVAAREDLKVACANIISGQASRCLSQI